MESSKPFSRVQFKCVLIWLALLLSFSTPVYSNTLNCRGVTSSYLKKEINFQKMNSLGYDIIETQPILSPHLAKRLIELLPELGTPTTQFDGSDFSTSYEIRIPKIEKDNSSKLDSLPPEIGKPILNLISELTVEINRKFASSEGKMQFGFGIIRDFSRNDLIEDFHTHQNGFFSATLSLLGPGTVVAIDPANPSLQNSVNAKENQLVLITDGQRARKKNILSSPHGSPKLKPGEQRLVLLVHFSQVQD